MVTDRDPSAESETGPDTFTSTFKGADPQFSGLILMVGSRQVSKNIRLLKTHHFRKIKLFGSIIM